MNPRICNYQSHYSQLGDRSQCVYLAICSTPFANTTPHYNMAYNISVINIQKAPVSEIGARIIRGPLRAANTLCAMVARAVRES